MDYIMLASSAAQLDEFRNAVAFDVASALALDQSYVTVIDVRQGSVVADVAIALPAGAVTPEGATALESALALLLDNPGPAFSGVRAAYGVSGTITATLWADMASGLVMPRTSPHRSHLSPDAIGGIVGGTVGGVLLVAAALAAVWLVRRQRAGAAAEAQASQGTVNISVPPVHGVVNDKGVARTDKGDDSVGGIPTAEVVLSQGTSSPRRAPHLPRLPPDVMQRMQSASLSSTPVFDSPHGDGSLN
jgi:hypothetical protein